MLQYSKSLYNTVHDSNNSEKCTRSFKTRYSYDAISKKSFLNEHVRPSYIPRMFMINIREYAVYTAITINDKLVLRTFSPLRGKELDRK